MSHLYRRSGLGFLLGLAWATTAHAASHPAGVTYPLTPAALQPSGLAQPLPSTRRYVLVWPDQLIPDGAGGGTAYSPALMQWVVTHYVGTQKLFQSQIDSYRALNPNFLVLTYHLAFGLNGADQTNPVGNITGPNKFGQEDTDTFTPWVAASGVTRENAYQHSATPASKSTRVSYPDPYWLMDIGSTEWQSYMKTTLLAWAAFPTTKATGFFFDVAFPPWYNYSPATWWTQPAGGSSRQALDTWWMPRAQAYFAALQAAFAPAAGHPRYLVIPNPDSLDDGTDEPSFLNGTDGVFTENWQNALTNPGNWNLTVRRICHYVTGHAKVWMTDSTSDVTGMPQPQRDMIIGTYLLIRDATSYIMLLPGLNWYPEYEIDLGGYVAEPPDDIEQLRVAGQGGANGGLYARQEVGGTVLVNSSSGSLTYSVPSPMKRVQWSGGGAVAAAGTEAAQSLTYTMDVPAGALSVPAGTAVILRSPSGVPLPGVEPGGGGGDGGTMPGGDGGTTSGGDGSAAGGDGGSLTGSDAGAGGGSSSGGASDGGSNAAPSGSSGGCGCRVASHDDRSAGVLAVLAACAAALRRRRRA
jgi:MYXO-CTERM domain-containing protein